MTKNNWEEEFEEKFCHREGDNDEFVYFDSFPDLPETAESFIAQTIKQAKIEALQQVRERAYRYLGKCVKTDIVYQLIDQQIKELKNEILS